LVSAHPPVPSAPQAPTHAAVAQLVEQRSPKPQGRGSSPRRRAGRPEELDRRRGYAAEWEGPHRTVNPDSWSAAGSIPAVPTVGPGRGFRFARRPEQRREVAQLEARRLREPEVAGSRPAFPTWGWVAQCGRASVSYSEGRGFEPRPNLSRAISSAEERPPHMREVGGSIPPLPTRGSVAQADQSSRLLTGRLEVRVLSDPLRPVAQGRRAGVS
jgi:hypothetical protein